MTPFEETFFYRLLVNCDDYGLMDARPQILKARLYPIRDSVRTDQIEKALSRMYSLGTAFPYQVGGKPYLAITRWDDHQQIRARRPKYPAPPAHLMHPSDARRQLLAATDQQQSSDHNTISDDIRRYQTKSFAPENPNPNPNPNPYPNPLSLRAGEGDGFAEFWEAYPRKEGEAAARRQFARLNVGPELLAAMLAAIRAWARSDEWQREGGRFVPRPAKWLEEQRWQDAPPVPSSGQGGKTTTESRYGQRDNTEATEDDIPQWLQDYRRETGT